MEYLTSESVTEGHPDKLADQIADAILDELLRQDPQSRVAVEVLISLGLIVIAGEVTTRGYAETQKIARKVIREVGYNDPTYGFDADGCGVLVSLHEQSPDIAMGVVEQKPEHIGAGDQGLVYGYAVRETKELMPLPIMLAHKLTRRLAEVRKKKILLYLRPDGKSQVTIAYKNGKPQSMVNVLVSAQHAPKIPLARIRRDIERHVIRKALPASLFSKHTEILVNPTGRFVIGGPAADTGLTGRKIIVDTYGGVGSHGGGAFSGKDPTKVDRSASYAARWVAKNIVAAGLAHRAEVRVAYAIGVPRPLSFSVHTHGTGILPDEKLSEIAQYVFDLRPGMIIKNLGLRRPLYRQVAAYGHFGRNELDLPWEKTNKQQELKRAAKKYLP